MRGHVFTALLKVVAVKVVLADDSCHHVREDLPFSGDTTNKRALFCQCRCLDGLIWSLEAQSSVFVVCRELFFASFPR